MKKRNAIILTTLVASSVLFLLDGKVDAANKKAEVTNAYHLNMRQSASSNAKIIAVLDKGNTVTVLNDSGSWDYIQYGNKKGYVRDKFLKVQNIANGSVGIVVNASKLNMRQHASANNSQIVAVLDKGNKVSVLRKVGSWYQIQYNGKTGYVNGKYINVSSNIVPVSSKPVTKPIPNPTKPSTPASTGTYKVVSGDNLFRIALKHNTTTSNLRTLNKLNSDLIRTGQLLVVTAKTTSQVAPSSSIAKNLTGKLIVLDPGHGDDRPGAIGNGLIEKELNYDVTLRVKALLEARGAKVVLTRIGDTDCNPNGTYDQDLSCRPKVANRLKADAFVSIHTNSGSSTAYGAESFYYKSSGKKLATAIQIAYVDETDMRNRRVAYNDLNVLRNSDVPATLVELGFLSNPSEAAKMKTNSFRNNAAIGITKGIVDYFGK